MRSNIALIIASVMTLGLIGCAPPEPPNGIRQLNGVYIDQRWETPDDYAQDYAMNTGRGVAWYSPDSYIIFTPHKLYRYNDQVCRSFTETVQNDEYDQEQGIACKDDDGEWEVVDY